MDEHGDTVGWRVRVKGGDSLCSRGPPLLAPANALYPGREFLGSESCVSCLSACTKGWPGARTACSEV